MIEIINNLIKIMVQFIEMFFTLQVDFDGNQISIGMLTLIFIFIVGAIWCVFYAFGIVGKEE